MPTPLLPPPARSIGIIVCAAFGALVVIAGLASPALRAQQAEEIKQVALTEAQVAGFIAAQQELQPLSNKLLEGGEKPDDAVLSELESIAKKHGFKSFAEMEEVGANISIVLDGLDRESGEYTDPIEKMKQELESIKADTSIGEADKKLVIDDLNLEIASAKPLQHKGNVEVVKKYQAELEKLIAETGNEDGGEPSANGTPE